METTTKTTTKLHTHDHGIGRQGLFERVQGLR